MSDNWPDIVRTTLFMGCGEALVVIRSMPGTKAAGTGGGAGSGDVGSRVGKSGARTSGNLLYRFSFGDRIFISRSF